MIVAHRIKRFVFWVGGVIFPAISQVSLEILAPGGKDSGIQLELRELERALWIGLISTEEFCRRAIDVAGAAIAASDLFAEIPGRVEPLPGMPELVRELARNYEVFLVSDYPRQWLQPALQRIGFIQQSASIFFVSKLGTSDEYADLVEMLVESSVIVPGSSLWVDQNPARTAVAIRRGIDASIFVDARRLYRDLGLWGLVTQGNRDRSNSLK